MSEDEELHSDFTIFIFLERRRRSRKGWKRGKRGKRSCHGVVFDVVAWNDTSLALELGLPPSTLIPLGHGEDISRREGELFWGGGGVGMQGFDGRNWRGRRLGRRLEN